MFVIDFSYESKIADLEPKIREAVEKKMKALTDQMYQKVQENVSGKVLQKRTGALARAIAKSVSTDGNVTTGTVYVQPAGPKEFALEMGGTRSYAIYPVKRNFLAWEDGGDLVFVSKVLNHPPSKAFRYLQLALEEMTEIVPAELGEAVESALR